MCRTSCTVYYSDQKMPNTHTHTQNTKKNTHTHIYINNILYIISTPACFDPPEYLHGALSFYVAKARKIFQAHVSKANVILNTLEIK